MSDNPAQDIEHLKAEMSAAFDVFDEAMQDYEEFKVKHAESASPKDWKYHAKLCSLIDKVGRARYVVSALCAPKMGCVCKFCGEPAEDPEADYFVCDECLDEISAGSGEF